uniref:Uncharacterized protein n=1 Tax=Graphocephala atropunctata TaxID=36148 RepID=A0A1B6KZJ8_9HEMI
MYIEIPQVSKCCGKIPLKLGSAIVAIENIVVGTLVICAAIYNIDADQTVLDNNLAIFTHYNGLVFSLLLGVCMLVTACLLLIALIKEKHNYILPFFLVQMLIVLMNVTGFITFLIRIFSSFLPNALYLIFFLLYGGLSFYCFIVVYSHYRESTWSSTVT